MGKNSGRGRSFHVDGWSEKAMDWILRATPHPNRNQLLVPAVAALAADIVDKLARSPAGPLPEHEALLIEGRALLREFDLRTPSTGRGGW